MSNLQKIDFRVFKAHTLIFPASILPDWEAAAYDSFSGMLRAVQSGECSYAMVLS